jgi:hypothetical protein
MGALVLMSEVPLYGHLIRHRRCYPSSGEGVTFDSTEVLGRSSGPTVGRVGLLATYGIMRLGSSVISPSISSQPWRYTPSVQIIVGDDLVVQSMSTTRYFKIT